MLLSQEYIRTYGTSPVSRASLSRRLLVAATLAGFLAVPAVSAQAARPGSVAVSSLSPAASAAHLAHLRAQQSHLVAHSAKQAAKITQERLTLVLHRAHLSQMARNVILRGRLMQAKSAALETASGQQAVLLKAALHQQHLAQMEVRMQRTLTVRATKLAASQQAMLLRQSKAARTMASLRYRAFLRTAKLSAQNDAIGSGNVVMAAYALRGSRYVMGGTSRSGFDCSGFVRYVLSTTDGVAIPRTAAEQFYHGQPVALDKMEPGDLVFFKNTYKRGISHVGIYAGQGKFIHAANAHKGVRMDLLNAPYYRQHFAGARRVLPSVMRQTAFLKSGY